MGNPVSAAIPAASGQQPTAPQDTGGAISAAGQAPAPPPTARKALVYVFREKAKLGGAGVYGQVFVNDEFLASLHNGDCAQREVPEGTVVFSSMTRLTGPWKALSPGQGELGYKADKPGELLRMEVQAGNTYYVEWYIERNKGIKMRLHPAKH